MMEQAAKIFLSEERGATQLEWFRSFTTFNFGNYQTEYKTPVDRLYVLNDDTLAGDKSLNLEVVENTMLVLLPVVGAVEYRDSNGNASITDAGCLQVVLLPAGSSYTITNPYANELVNFLQLWIKVVSVVSQPIFQKFSFNLDEHRNLFISSALEAGVVFHIAKLNGRQQSTVQFSNNTTAAFAFVIEGAFELEERLLHARDGLALWNSNQAEMEALSDDAIILILEMTDQDVSA
jgi:quercetin 2,3-dioxygenase